VFIPRRLCPAAHKRRYAAATILWSPERPCQIYDLISE